MGPRAVQGRSIAFCEQYEVKWRRKASEGRWKGPKHHTAESSYVSRPLLTGAGTARPCKLKSRQPGTSRPMPLEFDPPHPAGMGENSPTFQRWGREFRGAQVPMGRLKRCAIRQPSLRELWGHGRWFPTLKRWAITVCPSGTKTCPSMAHFLGASPSGIGRGRPSPREGSLMQP